MANNTPSYGMGGNGRAVHDADQLDSATAGRPLTTATNVAGAFVSVALIAGVGVWGYDLMVRDVSGVPVVRAATTEMRVRPEDPGGQLAQHQGLSVNEIAATGQASGPVDKVVLAPPAVALWVEDQPVPPAEPVVQREPIAPAASTFDRQKTEIDALIAQVVAESAGTTEARPALATDRDLPTAQPAVVIDAPGLRQSARPRLRPRDARAVIQPASFTPATSAEIDASAIPAGTRLAQLGAYDSADIARAEWQRMQGLFGEILQNKSRVVQEAQSGGRSFYRLRAMGFVDLNDTRRFCSAVKAEGVDCIPVLVK